MATEINCSCEITENEVIICYPPISSGGGGGITGVAPVGNVPKVATVDTGDVILTLEESSIDDLAAGLSIIKSAAGGQYINLIADNTDDDIEVQLNLISNNTANVYQAYLYISDPNTLSTIGLTQELDFIKLGFSAGGTDTVSLKMEFGTLYHKINNVDYLEMYTDTVYIGDRSQGAYLNIDSAGKLVGIGDALGVNNGNYISVDDATGIVLSASEIYLEGVNIPLGTAGKIAINSSGYLYTDTSGGGGGTTTNPLTIGSGLSGTSFDGSAAVTIQNQLITGLAGGQTLIGGTAAGDKLVIEVTSNATHTAARDLITLRKNSAAAASTSILMTIGDGQGLNNDELSIYTGNNSGTSGYLLRAGTAFAYFNASSSLRLQIAAADIIQLSSSTATMVQGITISDAKNIVLNTTTGTKIGTATSQKLAFWNKTPIVQPTTGITGAAFVSGGAGSNIKTDDTFGGYTLQQLAAIIINTGLAA